MSCIRGCHVGGVISWGRHLVEGRLSVDQLMESTRVRESFLV